MKIFITGATGFLGGHLIDQLLSEGHEVWGLCRDQKKAKAKKGLTWIQGDLDLHSLNIVRKSLPNDLSAVVHAAGVVHSFNEKDFYQVNTQGTANLVKSLEKCFPNIHFILISSLSAFGPNESKGPISHYGESKRQAEEITLEGLPKRWPLHIIRPPMIIGPRDPAMKDVFDMVKNRFVITAKETKGSPRTYSFICVFDLVRNIIDVLQRPSEYPTLFHTKYPESIEYPKLIGLIESKLQRRAIQIKIPPIVLKGTANLLSGLKKWGLPIQARLTPDKAHEILAQSWIAPNDNPVFASRMNWNAETTVNITCQSYYPEINKQKELS